MMTEHITNMGDEKFRDDCVRILSDGCVRILSEKEEIKSVGPSYKLIHTGPEAGEDNGPALAIVAGFYHPGQHVILKGVRYRIVEVTHNLDLGTTFVHISTTYNLTELLTKSVTPIVRYFGIPECSRLVKCPHCNYELDTEVEGYEEATCPKCKKCMGCSDFEKNVRRPS